MGKSEGAASSAVSNVADSSADNVDGNVVSNVADNAGGSANNNTANNVRELIFLGTGGACGCPSFYCGCEACVESEENPLWARACAGIAVRGTQVTLIDTPPELRLQLVREHISDINRVLYTHEHFDHTGGLPALEFYVRLKGLAPLATYGSQTCLNWLLVHFDFMADTLAPAVFEPFRTYEFDGVRYTPLPAAHCPDAFGYLIEFGRARVAYFPDTGRLSPAVLERLQGINVLIHDATYCGENGMPTTHSTPEDVAELASCIGAQRAYCTHLTMHYSTPTTAACLTERFRRLRESGGPDVRLAYDGLHLSLCADGYIEEREAYLPQGG